MQKLAWISLCSALFTSALVPSALAQNSAIRTQRYHWRNAAIIAGGFVDGLIFDPAREGLAFARTDIGGAYKWDKAKNAWQPLNDWAGGRDGNLLGCESIGIDPSDANTFYLALGTYTGPGNTNGAVVRTSDGGRTWKRTDVPFKMGGNEDGRSAGERLAVDPNLPSILYMGSRNDGLWRSEDYGATWHKDTAFPVTGRTNGIGVVYEVFDKSSGTKGKPTPTIYAGVSQNGPSIFMSSDAGTTWRPVVGQPAGLLPHQAVLGSNHSLYMTFGDNPGPNGMSGGAVWKYDTLSSVWTDITPAAAKFGYAGITIDLKHPSTVLVSTMDRWNPGDTIYRSDTGGTGWRDVGANTKRDWSLTPYLTFGNADARFGWWIGALAVDPFHPEHAVYGTGATIWETRDLTNELSGRTTHWSVGAKGLEETAVITLVSPPTGAHLISGLGDIGGLRHENFDVSPRQGMFNHPTLTNTDSIDFAALDAQQLVRVGRGGRESNGGYSSDNGVTWTPFGSMPANSHRSGTVAISGDGSSIVWASEGQSPAVSTDHGATWSVCSGVPASRLRVISDRQSSSTFYINNGRALYVSSDKGVSFQLVGPLPQGTRQVVAAPGHAHDLWATAGSEGLFHSVDGGAHFERMPSPPEVQNLGFGKAAPGKNYPAIYVTGQTSDGASGAFRSDDESHSWTRINDNNHQYGYSGQVITGDPRIYGRVYMGSNGRGVLYGDPVNR